MISVVFLAIIFVSCMVQGVTGFGFALLAAPLGLFFYDQGTLVVVLTIVSFILNSYLIIKIEAGYDRQLAKQLFLPGVVGVPIGVLMLTVISPSILKIFAALVAIFFGLLLFRHHRHDKTISQVSPSAKNHKLTAGIGFATGLLQSSVGLSGPPLVLLMTKYGIHPKVMRKTLALLFLSFSTLTLPIFLINNTITSNSVLTGLLAIPLVIAGGYIGNKIADLVPHNLFRIATLLLIITSGTQIILKAIKVV